MEHRVNVASDKLMPCRRRGNHQDFSIEQFVLPGHRLREGFVVLVDEPNMWVDDAHDCLPIYVRTVNTDVVDRTYTPPRLHAVTTITTP